MRIDIMCAGFSDHAFCEGCTKILLLHSTFRFAAKV